MYPKLDLFLDIETNASDESVNEYLSNIQAPKNYKDPAKISEWFQIKASEAKSDIALDQDYANIATIAVGYNNQIRIVDFGEFSELFSEADRVITFNGKKFDFPILIKTAIKHNLKFDLKKAKKFLKLYDTYPHVDMMELLAMNGQYKSLDNYLKIYLGRSKTPIDFATCTQQELDSHCLEDVKNLIDLYNKFDILVTQGI